MLLKNNHAQEDAFVAVMCKQVGQVRYKVHDPLVGRQGNAVSNNYHARIQYKGEAAPQAARLLYGVRLPFRDGMPLFMYSQHLIEAHFRIHPAIVTLAAERLAAASQAWGNKGVSLQVSGSCKDKGLKRYLGGKPFLDLHIGFHLEAPLRAAREDIHQILSSTPVPDWLEREIAASNRQM